MPYPFGKIKNNDARRNGRKRLLIVEDEKPLLSLLKDTFKRERFEVFTALTGKEGLRVALRVRPDLILLDILLPEMNGLSMLRKLRHDRYKWGKYVPVVILSNLSNPKTMAESAAEGVEDYLVKADWSLSDLVQKVKDKLNATVPNSRKTSKSLI